MLPEQKKKAMRTKKKKTVITTTVTEFQISATDIRKKFNLPKDAVIDFHVPGGGDWSNESIPLDDYDHQLLARFVETTEKEEESDV